MQSIPYLKMHHKGLHISQKTWVLVSFYLISLLLTQLKPSLFPILEQDFFPTLSGLIQIEYLLLE